MSQELLASKIVTQEDPPRIRQIKGVATNVYGIIGITERGPVGSVERVTSHDAWLAIFGGDIVDGDASHAVRGFFENGGQSLDFVRTVHYTDVTNAATKTSAAGTSTLQTAAGAPTKGSVLGTATEPFNLAAGDTVDVTTDLGGPTTTTLTATAASVTGGAVQPFILTDGMTLTFNVDGVPQSVTFLTAEFSVIGAATALEVAAVVNAKATGVSATVSAGAVKITSDTLGTGSTLGTFGGTALAVLGFTGLSGAGTGNVASIDAVTVAELKAAIELAVAGVTVSSAGGAVQIERNSAGAAFSVQVASSSTADDELGFDNATHSGTSGAAQDTLTVDGKTDGSYAADIASSVVDASSGVAEQFNYRVLDGGLVAESFPNVNMDTIVAVVNDPDTGSKYVALTDAGASGTLLQRRPANGTSANLTGGSDGIVGLSDIDFIGSAAGPTGLRVLDASLDLSILSVPDRPTSAVQNAMLSYCSDTRNGQCIAILDPPAGLDENGIVTYVETTASLEDLSEFGAIYWPQIKVLNPNTTVFGSDTAIVVPPSGHIAGVYARTDGSQLGGVFQQPAGIERGILKGVVGFETDIVMQEAKRDIVFPHRINPLTTEDGLPLYIDGARTLKGNGNFPSVGERRGVIYIEQSIKRGLQFVRHQNNTPALRARVNRTVAAFLLQQYNQGAFRGATPSASFFVDTGDALNTPTEIFAGKLIAAIGLATNKPAEFVVLRFSQDTRDIETELAKAGI